MGCGKQEWLDRSLHGRWCNPASVAVVGYAQSGADHASIVMYIDDGRAAAFSPVVTQVRAGSAPQHDEGGIHAPAGAAKSSDRRVWLSQADADRAACVAAAGHTPSGAARHLS